MRVLAITINMFPNSGWGRYARAIGFEFARQGVETDMLTYKKSEEPIVEGVCREYPVLIEKLSPISMVRNCLTVRKYAKNADVVHAFDVWPFSIYGYVAVLGTNKKLFVTGVGTYSVVPMRSAIKKFIIGLALRRAQRILSVSEYTKKRMLEMIKLDTIDIVWWGTSPLARLPEEKMGGYRQKFGITNEQPIILTVGQIKERKGQFDILKAVEMLIPKYPNILYCAIGSDKNKVHADSIRAYVKEKNLEKHFRFVTNAKTDEDLAFFYQSANIFAMTSNSTDEYFEGFGLVFLEAEYFGKPVIASRGSGTEEAMKDGYNGYTVNQRDSKDIAEKIAMILQGKEEEFGKNSIEFQKNFTWQKTADAYLSYYRK